MSSDKCTLKAGLIETGAELDDVDGGPTDIEAGNDVHDANWSTAAAANPVGLTMGIVIFFLAIAAGVVLTQESSTNETASKVQVAPSPPRAVVTSADTLAAPCGARRQMNCSLGSVPGITVSDTASNSAP